MVLRRPYAFLIKHFKLIHLIITAVLTILFIQNRNLYNFLGKCINDVVNKYDATKYIHYGVFILFILAIGLFYIVYWLLKYKDKPRKIYIMSMVIYGIIAIVIFSTFNYISGFSTNVIDQKTIRLYRDILLITMLLQLLITIIMLVRGLGFDIKKFNFNQDLAELNISQEDAEEVEVNIGIDTTNIMRKVRKQKREFGYFFQEYKIFILIILTIVLIIGISKGYSYFNQKLKVYKQNDTVGSYDYITITDSYYQILDDKYYAIVKFSISKDGQKERFNTNKLTLVMGDTKYVPDKTICSKFSALGVCYKKQYITNNKSSYIVAYSIQNLNIKKAYILYDESYDNNYKIKLNMANY